MSKSNVKFLIFLFLFIIVYFQLNLGHLLLSSQCQVKRVNVMMSHLCQLMTVSITSTVHLHFMSRSNVQLKERIVHIPGKGAGQSNCSFQSEKSAHLESFLLCFIFSWQDNVSTSTVFFRSECTYM